MGNTRSEIFNHDKEKEKLFLNSVDQINYKDLFMESLSPELRKLFKQNINLYYSQSFYEGISYECVLFDKKIDKKKAFSNS